MIKIRIENADKEEGLVLTDCELGEVVRLNEGTIGLVVENFGALYADCMVAGGLSLVSLHAGSGAAGPKVSRPDIRGAVMGGGALRIVEKLGKLRIDGV